MSRFVRAMIPLVAAGVGTWIGLGRPNIEQAIVAGTKGPSAAEALLGRVSPVVPPLEHSPLTTNPGDIPDPPTPWPLLNREDRVERAWLVSEGPAPSKESARRLVTFTFDDGPFPETAPSILRILSDHKIRAAFFFIGGYLTGSDRRAVDSRMWARRIADAGHYIGNHTFDHRRLTALSHSSAIAEIDDSAAAIESAVGKRPWLFRPPYGLLDPWLENALSDRRQELLLWNVDVQDIRRRDPDEILQLLREQLEYKRGGIVLLHDMHWPSVKAFSGLVGWLQAHAWDPAHPMRPGWDIVDLAEYLRATAASPQPYATREELERAREGLSDGENLHAER